MLVGAVAACGSSERPLRSAAGSTTSAPGSASTSVTPDGAGASAVGTYTVEHATTTFVDPSRPTRAHGGQPELRERTLPIDIWYPAGADGLRFPLLVFSHGSTRRAVDYAATLESWASAGYVVVGPDFPLSKTGTPGGTDYGDIESQARDVGFVISQVLDTPEDAARPWAKLVDPGKIGLGGQSMGAITTVAAAINPCCADRRVGAITEFAGAWASFGAPGPVAAAEAPPALLVHGSADPVVPYASATSLNDMYPGSHRLLTLVDSAHDPGFFGGVSTPLDELVTRATLAFYDAHLKDDPAGSERLDALVAAAGPQVATLSAAGNSSEGS